MIASRPSQNLSVAKRRAFKALTVLLALLTCFAGLEVGLRAFGPKYYHFHNRGDVYYSNPRGYFDVVGEKDGQVGYGIVHYCFGLAQTTRRVPAGVVDRFPVDNLAVFLSRKNTILGLGNSFTYGQGVRYEDIYLRRLERLLESDGAPVWIDNTAFGGFDLEEICDTYAVESSARRYPLVIYGFVLNDFGRPGADEIVGLDYIDINNGGYEYNPWRRHLATFNFFCHTIESIRLDRVTRQCYLDAFRGDNARKHFALLRDLNQRIETDGSQLVIVLFPLLYGFHDYPFQEIHDKMRSFCQAEGIPLLDLLSAFSRYKDRELWVHPVDHHPNEIAHEIAAAELHAFLKCEGLLETLAVDRSR